MMKNPYIAGSPLRDEQGFCGREDILSWVHSELLNKKTNALVLFGQRRVGKTTILLQLKQYLKNSSDGDFLPIYFDLQDQAKRNLGEVLADLAYEIEDVTEIQAPDPSNFDNNGRYFRKDYLPTLYDALDENCRPVFLLDEFDVLDQENETSLEETVAARKLFPFLRQVMSTDPRPAFVFVVGRRTEDLRIDFNQTFKTSLRQEVWTLKRKDAENLVRQAENNKTLSFTDEAITFILDLTNSHAYLTQLLCHRIWQQAHALKTSDIPKITVNEVKESIADTLDVGEHALTWLWDGLGPAEKIYASALAKISDQGQKISADSVTQVLAEHASRLRRREVELAPQDLVTRHVLEVSGDGEYKFAIELFRLWVREKRTLRDVVDEIDRVDPMADRLFQLGHDYFKSREWDVALRYFQDAIAQNPIHFQAHLYIGEVYLEKGQFSDAIKKLEEAYELDSYEAQYPLARALISHARSKQKQGSDKEALAACARALEISPNERLAQDIQKEIWSKQADAAVQRSDLLRALELYKKSNNTKQITKVTALIERENLKSLEEKAKGYLNEQSWTDAITIYEKLIHEAPDEESLQEWSHSLEQCKEELFLDDKYTQGLGALSRNDFKQAQRAFAEVVHVRPNYQKNRESAAKLLERSVAEKKTISLEKIFQSKIFRALSIISIVLIIGLGVFNFVPLIMPMAEESTATSTVKTQSTITQTPFVVDTPTVMPISTSTLEPTVTLQPTETPTPMNILVDSSRDGGVWWYPQGSGFNSDEPHQGKDLVTYLVSLGHDVTELPRPTTITYELLSSYEVVIRANEYDAYTSAEKTAYYDYVESGGNVLLLSDYVRPGESDSLGLAFGITFEGIASGSIDTFEEHPITNGISSLSYIAGSGVTDWPNQANILGYLSSNTYLDMNDNGVQDVDEPTNSPALGEMQLGKGKIVFCGDTNLWLNVPSQLIDNVFKYFAAK